MTKEQIIASLIEKHTIKSTAKPVGLFESQEAITQTDWDSVVSDLYDLLAPKDYKEITGFDTPNELAAYEEGREHEQETIFKFIENWNGETNSRFGSLLSKKLAPRWLS